MSSLSNENIRPIIFFSKETTTTLMLSIHKQTIVLYYSVLSCNIKIDFSVVDDDTILDRREVEICDSELKL